MATFFYYFDKVFDYLPLVCLWLCFGYLLGLYKAPLLVASFFDTEKKWLRRMTFTVLSVSFFACFIVGGRHLVIDQTPIDRWKDSYVILLVGLPLFFGSAMAAIFLVALGDERREYYDKEKQNRNVAPYDQK